MAREATASALRERRRQAGLSQAELAARAGVSRQLVQAVEAGHNTPAVDAALGLARALSTSVEELFAPSLASVLPALGGSLRHNTPLRVGRVADQLVAAELADHGTTGASWAKPDGVLQDGGLRLLPAANPAGLVLAGCDPALGIAESTLQGRGPSSLLSLSASTGVALRALAHRRLHAAVVHGPQDELPTPPFRVMRLHLARWQVGLATPPKLADPSLEALCEGHVPVAQREPTATSQQALIRAVARAGLSMPPGPKAAGHIDAARIAAVLQCAAITTEGVAHAFNLHFHPLEVHDVQIWIDERWTGNPAIGALANLLASRAFTDRVAQFGGYDLTDCGTRLRRRPTT
jgi:transcriptional regulator with XRE-family HTH domain